MSDQTVVFLDRPSGTAPELSRLHAPRPWTWLRKGIAALADQGMVSGATFVLNIFLARWLGGEKYGAYALAFSIFLFVASFHNALLLEPMSVFGPSTYRQSLSEYLGQLLRLHFVVTGLLATVLAVATIIIAHFAQRPLLAPAFWGISIAAPFILFFWLWRRAAYLEARPTVAIRGAIASAITVLALVALLQRLHWLTVFTAYVIQAAAGVIASIILIYSIRPTFAGGVHSLSSIFVKHWKYGRWVVVSGFVFWLNGGAYYVIVGSMLGMRHVGGLRAAQNFVLPVIQFLTATTLLVLPQASSWFNHLDRVAFRRNMIWITILFTAASIIYGAVIIIFGHTLVQLVYGGRYLEYVYLLPWLALSVILTAAAQGPTIALQAMQAPSEIFIGYTIGAATILPGIALTRYVGLLGAALGLALSSLAFLLYVAYRSNSKLKEAMPVAHSRRIRVSQT